MMELLLTYFFSFLLSRLLVIDDKINRAVLAPSRLTPSVEDFDSSGYIFWSIE